MKKITRSLFIFRRDLRLHDNTALIQALSNSEEVIPAFIFDQRQVGLKNEYRSDNAVQFMLESLDDLDDSLRKMSKKLYFFWGNPEDVVTKLFNKNLINAVFVNSDYTPFSIKRDEAIKHVCHKFDSDLYSFDDYLLNSPKNILTTTGQPYSIFTAYFNKSSKIPVSNPEENKFKNYYSKAVDFAENKTDIFVKVLKKKNPDIWLNGGRTEAIRLLKNISALQSYEKTRDFPDMQTSNLSAHNKFGTISIREVYWTICKELGDNHPIIKQIYWRDFFTTVAYFSPFVFGEPFYKKYSNLEWSQNEETLNAWKNGKTGFPIVDAGMRQLNSTGFMHNRVRMIAASFLIKDLHHNWLEGEKYFAQKLVDYDPAVNNGNWQWVASTGCDATPYFRIFNPWTQQLKFDPECNYIKSWVPELRDLPNSEIHNWFKSKITIKNYPKPIVDHKQEAEIAKNMYKSV